MHESNLPHGLSRFSLAGKVVVLTGGAGLYGRGLTADLAAAGATLVIASRNLDALKVVAEEEKAKGNCVEAESFDQSSSESIQALLDRVLQRFGRVDGLVNNSVARFSGGSLEQRLENAMQINATGLVLMHHYFGQAMARQGGGSIVNIGSIYGLVGPNLGLYADTNMPHPNPDYFYNKGGMINLTRYYAGMLGGQGVRVNCISPGGFFNNQPEPFVKRYEAGTYLNRMANPDDLGGAVIFLLSAAAQYITGVNLPVDGGYTAK